MAEKSSVGGEDGTCDVCFTKANTHGSPMDHLLPVVLPHTGSVSFHSRCVSICGEGC